MKRIILFMAYYGKLPSYFDIWLEAIKKNTSIDFCLITDCIPESVVKDLPKHINVHSISFDQFKQAIQNGFKFKVDINNYGRISQFRPAFAYIFPELVKGYDFWGYIECDLIPGDIRAFLSDELIEEYDKLFKLGHMQVFRNTDEMNTLFMYKTPMALDYKFAFSHNTYFFEEVIGMHNIAVAKNIRLYDKRVFTDCKFKYKPFIWSNFSYPGLEEKECIFEYDSGKLYRITKKGEKLIKEETLYAHFQKRKMEIKTKDFEKYIIIPNQFIDYRDVDSVFFDEVIRSAREDNEVYFAQKQANDDTARRKFRKTITWWQLYLIRRRIKLLGGVGLAGQKGHM